MFHQDVVKDKDDDWMLLQGPPSHTLFGDSDKISNSGFDIDHAQQTEEYRHQQTEKYRRQQINDYFVGEDNRVEFSAIVENYHDIKGAPTKKLIEIAQNEQLWLAIQIFLKLGKRCPTRMMAKLFNIGNGRIERGTRLI